MPITNQFSGRSPNPYENHKEVFDAELRRLLELRYVIIQILNQGRPVSGIRPNQLGAIGKRVRGMDRLFFDELLHQTGEIPVDSIAVERELKALTLEGLETIPKTYEITGTPRIEDGQNTIENAETRVTTRIQPDHDREEEFFLAVEIEDTNLLGIVDNCEKLIHHILMMKVAKQARQPYQIPDWQISEAVRGSDALKPRHFR